MKNNIKINKTVLISVAAVVAAIIMIIVGVSSVQANAIAYEEIVTEAKSAIRVQEKKRSDSYPLLADCVKSYDEHEAEAFLNVVVARTEKDGTITDDGVNEINNKIDMLLEAYPTLSSQENYKTLMNDISIQENKIADTREAYNKAVTRYNTYTRHPIRKFFLSLSGYERIEFPKLTYDVSEDAPTNLFD